MNWYAYAGDNPVVWVDPPGLFGWSDIENAVNAVGSVMDAAYNWAVDNVGNAVMGVLWPGCKQPCPSARDRNPELADIYDVIGRGEGFDAREASKDLLVKPGVAVLLARGVGKMSRITDVWAQRGIRLPKGARPAGIKNRPYAVRVGDLVYNPHRHHAGEPWHLDVYNVHKPGVHWRE
jgi:hypothetical protein